MNDILLIVNQIKNELKEAASKEHRLSTKRFFKEDILLYGVKAAALNKIAKTYLKKVASLQKEEVFTLAESLFSTMVLEEALIASKLVLALKNNYQKDDFYLFERWINSYITNWAVCDTFCNHVMGEFLMLYPHMLASMNSWAKSTNRWVKRALAVSLIIPAKKGLFEKEVLMIADLLLFDQDDMVQKGYGWLLKALSETKEEVVFSYVLSKKALMPRVAYRYAIEKMSKDKKLEAMAK